MAGREFVVGVSGASGALLARRFVEIVLPSPRLSRLHLVFTAASLRVAGSEMNSRFATVEGWIAALSVASKWRKKILVHANDDVGASIASGSYPVAGMIVVPCSAGALGSIANGVSRDLVQRAADVCLKERRPLVIAFRESPYSMVHIENMRRATAAGAIVAPPSPAFYIASPSVERFLDAYCVRAARLMGLEVPGEQFRWTGEPARKSPRRP